MKIIGITGAVASGKNFIADIFAKNNVPIFDADNIVHHLLNHDQDLIDAIAKKYPQALIDGQVSGQVFGKISRKILGEIVFNDKKQLQILEQIIHPKVREQYQIFIQENREKNIDFVVLNIPLLLEKEGYFFDYLIAIKCDTETRKKRFLQRYLQNQSSSSNLNNNDNLAQISDDKIYEIFDKINSLQMTEDQRCAKANFIIDNNGNKNLVEKVENIIDIIKNHK